jgi:hypothetical protein
MRSKEFTIKAYFESYDRDKNKLIMLFLDDEVDTFTKSFLTKYYSSSQYNPIHNNKFDVKYTKKSIGYLDKAKQAITSVHNLMDQIVNMTVYISHYNFNANGKRIVGWNINLVDITPVSH